MAKAETKRTQGDPPVAGRVRDEQIALTSRAAAELAGFGERRLRAWEARGLVRPGVERDLSPRNTVRLYGFHDLVELLVAKALLSSGRSPQQIWRVVEHLRRLGYEAPLRELVFAVSGEHIYFQHPDGTWEGDERRHQIVLMEVLNLERIRAQIREAVSAPRTPNQVGRVDRKRNVVGSKPVIAGTRTPVEAVLVYVRRGLPDGRILEAFPHLTNEDITAIREQYAV